MLENASVQARLEGVGRLSRQNCRELGVVGPAGAGLRSAPRCAPRSSLRRVPVRPHPGRDGVGRRCACARPGPLARGPAVARFRDRAAREPSPGRASGGLRRVAPRRARGRAERRLARRDRPRRRHRRAPERSGGTRSWIRRSTTGALSPRRCPAIRSRTFRSATRASTSPTRGTISDAEFLSTRWASRAPAPLAFPTGGAEFPERFRAARRSMPAAAARCRECCRTPCRRRSSPSAG